jgi:hypothetical protein
MIRASVDKSPDVACFEYGMNFPLPQNSGNFLTGYLVTTHARLFSEKLVH